MPVFLAQAGVFPQGLHEAPEGFGLPRASGSVSDGTTPVAAFGVVFPAQAGVFPLILWFRIRRPRLPRASGGVSAVAFGLVEVEGSSPRKRGCFRIRSRHPSRFHVFPAQAGVFLSAPDVTSSCFCLPRASGGVSSFKQPGGRLLRSSPRKRGCFPCRPVSRRRP